MPRVCSFGVTGALFDIGHRAMGVYQKNQVEDPFVNEGYPCRESAVVVWPSRPIIGLGRPRHILACDRDMRGGAPGFGVATAGVAKRSFVTKKRADVLF